MFDRSEMIYSSILQFSLYIVFILSLVNPTKKILREILLYFKNLFDLNPVVILERNVYFILSFKTAR